MEDLESLLLEQELYILHQPFSAATEKLLGQELWEIGANGEVHSREELCRWLRNKRPGARWELKNFEVQMLHENLALANYSARMIAPEPSTSKGALHTSLWQKNSAGSWQMIFHQATKIL